MKPFRVACIVALVAALGGAALPADAQTLRGPIKIGVMLDHTGPFAAAGSLADADRIRLATEGGVDDLLLIDPDQSSNDPEVVSVLATEAAWTGSARAETGECFWIRVAAGAGGSLGTVYGTGTDCSADEASTAEPGAWPEP